MTKTKTRTKRPAKTTRRRKVASDPAPPNPANIPPLDVAIPEEPDHLRKREEAFQRRRRVTR